MPWVLLTLLIGGCFSQNDSKSKCQQDNLVVWGKLATHGLSPSTNKDYSQCALVGGIYCKQNMAGQDFLMCVAPSCEGVDGYETCYNADKVSQCEQENQDLDSHTSGDSITPENCDKYGGTMCKDGSNSICVGKTCADIGLAQTPDGGSLECGSESSVSASSMLWLALLASCILLCCCLAWKFGHCGGPAGASPFTSRQQRNVQNGVLLSNAQPVNTTQFTSINVERSRPAPQPAPRPEQQMGTVAAPTQPPPQAPATYAQIPQAATSGTYAQMPSEPASSDSSTGTPGIEELRARRAQAFGFA